ncbi:MAG: NUDIX hydrolase [Pseudohongiellaceae bacterium]
MSANNSNESAAATVAPAATVVLMREAEVDELEVLLLRRNARLVFHGGHWVFPGGRLDAEDYAAAEGGLEYPAAIQAAVRETYEEAGITINQTDLIHLAHWTTPPGPPRRFCTWFFLCPLRQPVEVQIDNDEILEYRWLTPTDALAESADGNLTLPRPTLITLTDLAAYKQLDVLLAEFSTRQVRVFPENSRYFRPREMGCPI